MDADETRPGHDLRFCKLPNCENELVGDEPSRGIWANICVRCRRGETPAGLLYREQRGLSGQAGATGSGSTGGGLRPSEGGLRPSDGQPAGPSLEVKARAIVPLARRLEQKVTASKAARLEAARTVDEFAKALAELRDAAQALIR
jgi:hypothetical protein